MPGNGVYLMEPRETRSENSRFSLHACSTKRTESWNCIAMKMKKIEISCFVGDSASDDWALAVNTLLSGTLMFSSQP